MAGPKLCSTKNISTELGNNPKSKKLKNALVKYTSKAGQLLAKKLYIQLQLVLKLY